MKYPGWSILIYIIYFTQFNDIAISILNGAISSVIILPINIAAFGATDGVWVGRAIVGVTVLTEDAVIGVCVDLSVGDGVGSNVVGNGVWRF